MGELRIGDFVTGYGSGYWQLMDIKPKIADEDDTSGNVRWRKGQVIGQWVILKKCFTNKMKPRIDFSYEDAAWVKPVGTDILTEIQRYFEEHPEYKRKFDTAVVKLRPMITNCWFDLPEEMEEEFKSTLQKLPDQYTMEAFWNVAKDYQKYVSDPPARYLLNLFTYPWDMDKKANLIYFGWELIQN